MNKTLIKSILMCLCLSPKAWAMAPAVACGPSLCPWLENTAFLPQRQDFNLVLKKFPSDGIEAFMPVGRSNQNGIPTTVEGLWWMDFNQEGDILVTFATATWNQATRTAVVPVYGERTYSFKATNKAAKSYAPLLATRYTYRVEFNEAFTQAEITPSLRIWGHRVTIPKAVAHFTMRYDSDGHWVRESWVLGRRLPDYDLLRVVRADLTRDAAYADYLKIAGHESYLAVPKDSAENWAHP